MAKISLNAQLFVGSTELHVIDLTYNDERGTSDITGRGSDLEYSVSTCRKATIDWTMLVDDTGWSTVLSAYQNKTILDVTCNSGAGGTSVSGHFLVVKCSQKQDLKGAVIGEVTIALTYEYNGVYCVQYSEGGSKITYLPPTYEDSYIVVGTTSGATARSTLFGYIPANVAVGASILYITQVTITLRDKTTNVWDCNVAWGLKSPAIQFSTSGATTKITQAIATTDREADPNYPPGSPNALIAAPDVKGGIGLNASGAFDGIDIVIPQFSWQETYSFAPSAINFAFAMTLTALTGTTNASSFRGFAAGEVLFMGASGGIAKNDNEADVQFSFAASPNVYGITIGDCPAVDKTGWQYIWCRYMEDPVALTKYKKPVGVYVNTVYKSSNFGLLGIGS